VDLESSIVPRSAFHQTPSFCVTIVIWVRKERVDCWLAAKLIVLWRLHVLLRCGQVSDLNLKFHGLSSFYWGCNDCTALVAQIDTFEEAHGLLDIIDLLLSSVSCSLRA
jgi:hypothetical protein